MCHSTLSWGLHWSGCQKGDAQTFLPADGLFLGMHQLLLRLSTVGPGLLSPEPSCLVLEAGPGAGGTASEESERPSPPLRWPRWWFWSLAPPQIGCVSPGCGTSALAGGLAGGAWESPALPQSGLRMAKGQALMAFPTGKCPPTEWYFPRATFREGRVASGSESPSLRPRPAALSVTRRFNAAPRSCCVEWGKRFGLMSSLRFKGPNSAAQF